MRELIVLPSATDIVPVCIPSEPPSIVLIPGGNTGHAASAADQPDIDEEDCDLWFDQLTGYSAANYPETYDHPI